MKNLFRIILALTVASLCRAQQVNGGGTSATSISTVSKIVNDVTTNATMFPVWVTANSGNLPLKVSSTLFQFNPSTGNMNLSGGLILGSTAQAPATMLQVIDTGTGTPRGIMHDQYNTGTNSAQINTRKARGTFASPTTIVTGDILGRHLFWGYDGSNFIESGNIRFTSSGTIAATRVPSQFEVWTSTDATPSVLTKQLTIDNTGLATLTGSAHRRRQHVHGPPIRRRLRDDDLSLQRTNRNELHAPNLGQRQDRHALQRGRHHAHRPGEPRRWLQLHDHPDRGRAGDGHGEQHHDPQRVFQHETRGPVGASHAHSLHRGQLHL